VDSANGNFDGLDSDRDRVTMNDRMTHDIKRNWSRFGPDRRLLAVGARHRLPASSTDADNRMPGISGTDATQRICVAPRFDGRADVSV